MCWTVSVIREESSVGLDWCKGCGDGAAGVVMSALVMCLDGLRPAATAPLIRINSRRRALCIQRFGMPGYRDGLR